MSAIKYIDTISVNDLILSGQSITDLSNLSTSNITVRGNMEVNEATVQGELNVLGNIDIGTNTGSITIINDIYHGTAPQVVAAPDRPMSISATMNGVTNQEDLILDVELDPSKFRTLLVTLTGASSSELPYPGYHTSVYHVRVSWMGTGYNVGSIQDTMNSDVGTNSQVFFRIVGERLHITNNVIADGHASKKVTYRIDLVNG